MEAATSGYRLQVQPRGRAQSASEIILAKSTLVPSHVAAALLQSATQGPSPQTFTLLPFPLPDSVREGCPDVGL